MNSDSSQNSLGNLPTGSAERGLAPGVKLGVYTLVEPLGRGGMGQVWKAEGGRRTVALKVLPPEFRDNPEAMTQVRDSFDLIHALTHEHICPALDLQEDRLFGPYLVMHYVPGVRLSEFVRRPTFADRRLSSERVVQILRPIAAALDYAHQKLIRVGDREQRGVLHRDVKPDNIMLVLRDDRIEEVFLIDFGLAAEIRSTMSRHTSNTVDTRGTRPYMAPEQLRGKRHQWDGRTDQYALAAVAYELLAGHLPFDSDDDFALMVAISQEPADPIAGLPEALNGVLLRGLSKAKEDRFESCREFLEAMDQAVRSPAILSREPTPASPKEVVPIRLPTIANSVGMRLVLIPAGEFLMGSYKDDTAAWKNEKPQHKVRITEPFYLGIHEVTQGQWQAVLGTSPWRGQKGAKEGPDYPVTYVSWEEVTEFCRMLSAKEGKTYRLPTEAEWEYSCRAGTITKYHFGDAESQLGDCAWCDENANAAGEKYAHAVGRKKPNAWGLYDLHGNVWEWCSDWYGEKYYGETSSSDPAGPSGGSGRVFRGGCWFSAPADCRSAVRGWDTPGYRFSSLGFRVALVP
jgi:formylglycine-generating enzyme required for sulfatase activity